MSSRGFQFKQFFVAHDRCAMKVGVDSVLLGSWVEAEQPARILDLGSGSGLLALMMAQKFPLATIDAVDLDNEAAGQAEENFKESPWAERLSSHHADVLKWGNEIGLQQYDLIICNPPYFKGNALLPDGPRKHAREQGSLDFKELARLFARLLKKDGQAYLVIPASGESELSTYSEAEGLKLTRRCAVYGSEKKKAANRILLTLGWRKSTCKKEVLRVRKGSAYSEEYNALCSDFYLSGRTV